MTEAAETYRITSGDCLYWLYEDLKTSSTSVHDAPWAWIEAAASLLSQVPDLHQRMAWTLFLASSITTAERPVDVLVRHLWVRAERINV